MPKLTIIGLTESLTSARSNAESYRLRNIHVERELADLRNINAELIRERNWLRQLCQEQSSSIANYMRSRN